jgi:hypothetical protein
MSENTNIDELYKTILMFVDQLAGEYHPEAIAGVTMAISMSLYKTILEENDFNEMMDAILESRDQVTPFNVKPTSAILQ